MENIKGISDGKILGYYSISSSRQQKVAQYAAIIKAHKLDYPELLTLFNLNSQYKSMSDDVEMKILFLNQVNKVCNENDRLHDVIYGDTGLFFNIARSKLSYQRHTVIFGITS